MGLTRRDAWMLTGLLLLALVLLGRRVLALRPQPPEITRLTPPAPLPRLDLNRASAAELEALPGVGPKLASELVAHRPYRTLDELAQVPGLGPRGVERLAARLQVTP